MGSLSPESFERSIEIRDSTNIMIYLDNSATTIVSKEVAELVARTMVENFGNPSAQYYLGAEAYKAIGFARSQVAKILATAPSNIHFTSGGTESNNIAILGCAKAHPERKHIVTTAIEHDSVLNACEALSRQGYHVDHVLPDKTSGCIRAEDIVSAVQKDTLLVSCMFVNNETGEILPIKRISQGVRARNPQTIIHCDCVQGFGKIPCKVHEYDVDLISASGHKLHAPKGVGILYQRTPALIEPLMFGGNQEMRIHPGTENVPSICGFGLAADQAAYMMTEKMEYVGSLKDHLKKRLEIAFPFVRFNCCADSSPYILNFSLSGFQSQDMIRYLSLRGMYVSSGSACSLGTRSHVLEAMGLADEYLDGAIRVSLSRFSTVEELDKFVLALTDFALSKIQ